MLLKDLQKNVMRRNDVSSVLPYVCHQNNSHVSLFFLSQIPNPITKSLISLPPSNISIQNLFFYPSKLFIFNRLMNFLKNTDSNFEDAALLKKFKETGDRDMLASLFGRYMEMVFGVCLKYLEDREDAKDAVMNIYEELEKKALKHEVDNFKSWLYVLSKNHCLMHLRSKKNVKNVALNPSFMHSEEETHLNGVFEKEETMMKMEGCIKTLNTEQQQCIVAFYLQQKSYQEIAAETEMDWNKVRSLIQNGRRNLKICMEK